MSTRINDQQVSTSTRYQLITEFAPGRFSIRTTGTQEQVMEQHQADLGDPAIAGRRQAIQAVSTIVVTSPAQWLENGCESLTEQETRP